MPDSYRMGAEGGDDVLFDLSSVSHRTLLQIKSWLPKRSAGERSLNIAGRDLPTTVGETLPGPLHILCLSPCEWLLASDKEWASNINQQLAAVPLQLDAVLSDVSHGYALLHVRGRATRDVLAKACGIDLHPLAFPVGRCARTRLAQVPVIIDCVDVLPGFDLYVARSYQRYLVDWLLDAAAEFTSSHT